MALLTYGYHAILDGTHTYGGYDPSSAPYVLSGGGDIAVGTESPRDTVGTNTAYDSIDVGTDSGFDAVG